MKTEKEFSDYFFNHYIHQINSDQESFKAEVENLALSYWSDLTTHITGYFSFEDRLAITELAAQKLVHELKNKTFIEAWKQVIRDFVHNQQWGYLPTSVKPKKIQTEEQKIFWKLFKYAWAFFQSMVILKIAVYYFGLESADHPNETSVFWVWFFFGLSAFSLAFFAYRNRHDNS